MIKELIDNISKFIQGVEIGVAINEQRLTYKDEEYLTSTVVRSNSRINGVPFKDIIFELAVGGRTVFSLRVAEFPACCGKTLIHQFGMADYLINSGGTNSKMSEGETMLIVSESLTFIQKLLSHMGYTVVTFVVSEIDNRKVWEAFVNFHNLKPSHTFSNRRNGHKCHSYELLLEGVKVE